ncbi:MAG: DUF4434 domain-containing protein [Oscillospiraceae bacterium]|nr:DUF4434 domain-containing protein [Oscillospiraceae bacterium]
MKQVAKLLALLLSLTMLFSFSVSCQPAGEENSKPAEISSETVSDEKSEVGSFSENSSFEAESSSPVEEEGITYPKKNKDGGYGLVTDEMDQLCKPMVTGDFIQYWYCRDWDREKWLLHLNQLKAAGITSLVIQTTFNVSGGWINQTAFRHDLPTSAVSAGSDENPEFLGLLLSCLKETGMTLWIGLGMNDAWWGEEIFQKDWCLKEAEFNNLVMDEIHRNYFDEYREQIAGFYWPYEMYVQNAGLEENWAAMINKNLDHLTALDPSVPMMFCPYISEWYVKDHDIRPEDDAKVWKELVKNTRFRDGDIFCPQDCMASVDIEIERVVAFLVGMKEAVESSSADVKFWLDMENYASGSLGVFLAQLDVGSRLAENMVCFSYSHYYAPTANKGVYYHNAYAAYVKTLEE